MSSTFGTYKTAYSGMYTSQAGLGATSNNLANVNTTGSSRTRVSAADKVTAQSSGSMGTGADVSSITRIRDQLLDQTYRAQNSQASYWSVKNGNLEYMQELMSEFGTTDSSSTASSSGLQATIEGFFNDWSELAKDPSSQSTRQALVEAANSLVSNFSELDQQLQQLQQDACNSVKDGVDSLNNLASKVAVLNGQISQAEVGNSGEASYLEDQRDELLDQISSLANISVTTGTDGTVQVSIGGTALVDGTKTRTLTVAGDGSISSPLQVQWVNTGNKAEISGGSIKAYLEDAEQTGYSDIATATLPYSYSTDNTSSISTLRQGLNNLLTTVATEVNSLLSSGTDLDGNSGSSIGGFFTPVDSGKALGITNIQVNPAIVSDTDKIAISATGKKGDGTIAKAISNLTGGDYFSCNGLAMNSTEFYAALTSWIGTAGSNASSNYSTQSALVTQIDTQRQTVSGISLDDEMSNMIVYQNAYNASAKVLSTIDELVAGLISDLGGELS
ncbi:flagellar hook-associated protein FlgK [Propionispora hippei]|uniref:Flagellar hook-associated protein 1 n=1 Tax=Propionispora hippei DSM 15287 TaxID=1123003 RepID=A0A1M6C125_9FIRM|nr:flagellar hook-associated protein FlgK [Propionispora hippei]SHI54735.1 flagellar hook-associated protein 1 FlgK [Propionispora hippei DSM 15287]